MASGNGHAAIVEILLEYEAEVNHVASDPQKSTPLGEALENRHKEVVKLLINVSMEITDGRVVRAGVSVTCARNILS